MFNMKCHICAQTNMGMKRTNNEDNPLATKVKLADLRHNSDTSRLDCVDDKTLQRRDKYIKAAKILGVEMFVTYYQDDDTGAVIRFSGARDFEIYRANEKRWELLPPDNSYMREVFIGQGNNCLTVITKEAAEKIMNESKSP